MVLCLFATAGYNGVIKFNNPKSLYRCLAYHQCGRKDRTVCLAKQMEVTCERAFGTLDNIEQIERLLHVNVNIYTKEDGGVTLKYRSPALYDGKPTLLDFDEETSCFSYIKNAKRSSDKKQNRQKIIRLGVTTLSLFFIL